MRFSSRFCSQPRKNSSSGTATKKKVKSHALGDGPESRPDPVNVQEAKGQTKRQSNWRVNAGLAQSDSKVAQPKAQVEAGSIEVADQDEAVDSRIEKKNLVEDRQMRRPRALKPAQIDSQTQRGKNQEVAPVALVDRDRCASPATVMLLRRQGTRRTRRTTAREKCPRHKRPADRGRTRRWEARAAPRPGACV